MADGSSGLFNPGIAAELADLVCALWYNPPRGGLSRTIPVTYNPLTNPWLSRNNPPRTQNRGYPPFSPVYFAPFPASYPLSLSLKKNLKEIGRSVHCRGETWGEGPPTTGMGCYGLAMG